MRKKIDNASDDEMLPEHDLSKMGKPVRGKYARAYHAGSNLVLLSPDVAEVFPDDASVNQALRVLIIAARGSKKKAAIVKEQ